MNVTGWLKRDGKWKVNRIIGVVLVGLAVIVSLTGCFYTPYDPDAMDAALKNASPSFLTCSVRIISEGMYCPG